MPSYSPGIDTAPFDGPLLTRLRRRLRAWYQQRARDLPWRRSGDPYRIWISEIMLQQTTVASVVPYFERFMDRFPTIHELASAEQDEVLRYWEGLGYYSRARNIHKAAQVLVEQHAGEFPREVDYLMALPGIGRYTAGAILSFAFDQPAPILEANTLRLYCRLLGYDADPRSSAGQRVLWSFAEHLVPRKNAGQFNQALMELGSLVCSPTVPNCLECPVNFACRAYACGRQDQIPQAAVRPEITRVTEFCVAVQSDSRFLLRRNPEGERWAGLWDFVRFSLDGVGNFLPAGRIQENHQVPAKLAARLDREVQRLTGQQVRTRIFLTSLNHSVTRYRIRLICALAESEPHLESSKSLSWRHPADFDDVPFSVTGRKLAQLLQARFV